MSFIDTNVLVYSTVNNAPFRDRARNALARFGASGPLLISRQILREYLAVMTREQVWAKPLTLAEAITDAESFMRRFIVLEDVPAVWTEFVSLSRHAAFGGRQVHDANIVATMLAHRERRLVTFNGGDFRRFAGLIDVVTP